MLVRRTVVLTIALSVALVACSPSPSPSAVASASLEPRPPAPSVGREPSTAPSQRPPASEPPVSDPPLAWVALGVLDEVTWIDGIMATDRGYIVRGATGENDAPAVWFSVDGRSWSRTDLWEGPRPCGVYPYVTLGAASPHGAVLLGIEQEGNGACIGRVASWFSADGRTWRRSASFDGDRLIDGSPVRIWATDAGWEAVISDANNRYSIWTSTDGLAWRRGVDLPIGELETLTAAAVDGSGTRVLSITSGDVDPPVSILHRSTDGRDWQAAGAPGGTVTTLLPPGGDGANWLAVTTDDSGDFVTSSTSVATDLVRWSGAPFPLGLIRHAISTADGYLALGGDACAVTGSACVPAERPAAYLASDDGLAWTPLEMAVGPEFFADGPAGVVGVDPEGSTWHLETFTPDEAALLAGIRDDARSGCRPRREDLPPRAIAGVECSPNSPIVEAIGAYRFATADDLLDAYFARLAAEGVEPRSGSCPPNEGEGAYVPEDPTDPAPDPHRLGCFLNDSGYANVRSTEPGALVYVGVLGRSGDLRALVDWVWQGNQDQPGSPTIWSAPTP